MQHPKLLARIRTYPAKPTQMLKNIFEKTQQTTVPMNLATIDKEFGVLNRTVMYRGMVDDSWICFVTERNSRKYQNLKENPKLSLTLLLALETGGSLIETWQVRLFDAEAVEMDKEYVQKLWKEEPLYAQIRSQICECGKPRDPAELKERCEELMAHPDHEELQQTRTYTAFKIISKRWDFYKSEPEKIADRLQYKLTEKGEWEVCHVDA